MGRKILGSLIIVISFISCIPRDNIVRPEPKEPEDTDWCKAGCEHLMTLPGQDGLPGCVEGRPLYLSNGGKVSCEQFCVETQQKGRALNPKCWTTLNSCEDLETTCRR